MENFRANIAKGYLPIPKDVTFQGGQPQACVVCRPPARLRPSPSNWPQLLAARSCAGIAKDYFFDTTSNATQPCHQLFCPIYSVGLSPNPLAAGAAAATAPPAAASPGGRRLLQGGAPPSAEAGAGSAFVPPPQQQQQQQAYMAVGLDSGLAASGACWGARQGRLGVGASPRRRGPLETKHLRALSSLHQTSRGRTSTWSSSSMSAEAWAAHSPRTTMTSLATGRT